MKLCVPIDVKPQGGVYTFVGNLLAWLDRQGVPHTSDIDADYDVLFVNSWVVPHRTVKRVKTMRPAVRVVHRVDGAAVDYGSDAINDRVQARVNLLADLTIFQSEYSRYSTTTKYRVVMNDGPVIYNPVDIEMFAPAPRVATARPRVACASWSVNRGKGTWQIDALASAHPDVDFVLCGRFEPARGQANIEALGRLDRMGMAKALRSCDVFLNLSENDPCPNVVLEAMASGLPVIFTPSGGVPELVGECGAPLPTPTAFAATLAAVLEKRDLLGQRARQRAVEQFAPDVIFPRYLDAMRSAEPRSAASPLQVLSMARKGYPVLPAETPLDAARVAVRRSAALWRRWQPARRDDVPRIGWVTYDSYPRRKRRFSQLDPFTGMRAGNIATALDQQGTSAHELYDPTSRYDVVVFQKMMDARCQEEMARIQGYGGKVIFDANVNYYEVWGDYFVPGTEPTVEQQRDARLMTTGADWVVADSTYLERIIRGMTSRVTWIPDNVDLSIYGGRREHQPASPVRLVWSGVGKKAAHLLDIREVLGAVPGIELVLVTDEAPPFLEALRSAVPCRVEKFSDRRYASILRSSDIIISPKRLVNAYEMAHTEYKITLGMAAALPAIASPQPSYQEAIGHAGGGVVADGADSWAAALHELVTDHARRRELGARARQTVEQKYALPVVAAQYSTLLHQLVGVPPVRESA